MQSYKVELLVYDLSRGLARSLSRSILGIHLEAIWHTSVVVYNIEHFFGQGIQQCSPKQSPMGEPLEIIDMGNTFISQSDFEEYLAQLSSNMYTPFSYHLLDRNCNHFSATVVEFLTGSSIPNHIESLPAFVMSTPFGSLIRPYLEQLYGPSSLPRDLLTPATREVTENITKDEKLPFSILIRDITLENPITCSVNSNIQDIYKDMWCHLRGKYPLTFKESVEHWENYVRSVVLEMKFSDNNSFSKSLLQSINSFIATFVFQQSKVKDSFDFECLMALQFVYLLDTSDINIFSYFVTQIPLLLEEYWQERLVVIYLFYFAKTLDYKKESLFSTGMELVNLLPIIKLMSEICFQIEDFASEWQFYSYCCVLNILCSFRQATLSNNTWHLDVTEKFQDLLLSLFASLSSIPADRSDTNVVGSWCVLNLFQLLEDHDVNPRIFISDSDLNVKQLSEKCSRAPALQKQLLLRYTPNA